jgi:branched-chain amino acid aminotransferase
MAIQKTEKIWHNGKLIAWDDATIHVMAHVIHYGSSVFEGVRCYAPPSGPAIFRAPEHAQRLLDSAKVYRIDVDFTRDDIVKAMCDVVANNGVWPCYLRPVVLRGYGEAGVNPFNSPTEVYVVNYPWGKYLGSDADQGCDVCVSSWTRLAPNTLPAMAKAGANYMNSQLIKMEAIVNGYAEGIALDTSGYVSGRKRLPRAQRRAPDRAPRQLGAPGHYPRLCAPDRSRSEHPGSRTDDPARNALPC